ncbi:MAG: flagellar export chaperone FliS [Acidobacteria bacterium]|nr:flagellar export chaperone FliS [Acidobacteriota bacterium]
MYAQPKALASYGRIANSETNPLKQIVMLYDGAIKFLNLTAVDIETGDLVAKAEHSSRALDIVHYLQSILDFEKGGPVAESLDKLYRSITVLILRASAELDPALMRRAAELLVPVRDAWETNSRKLADTPPTPAPDAQPVSLKLG